MQAIYDKLGAYTALTDEKLRQILNDADMSKLLFDSMTYSVFAGGKRLRPALCLASCELLGGMAEAALLPACAVEMIHTYSLIHDDLPALDNDDLRRGKPSSHIAFGEANAIIAGDGLQTLAFLTAAQMGNPAVMQALTDGAFQMVVGQSYDLNANGDAALLEIIHRLKTGALIRAAVLAGAHCAEADEQELAALASYAEQFGLLFQITDDILDVTGETEQLGKTAGKDVEEDKLTFVVQHGLAGARRKAEEAAGFAHAALEPFGDHAWFFHALTDMMLTRRA